LGHRETDALGLSHGSELGYLVWVLKGIGTGLFPEPNVLRFKFLIATFQRQSLALTFLKFLSHAASIPIDRFPALPGFPSVATDGPLLHEYHSRVDPVMWKQGEVHQTPSLMRTEKSEVLHHIGFWVNTNRRVDCRALLAVLAVRRYRRAGSHRWSSLPAAIVSDNPSPLACL
jgi:hypothetical protein